MAKHLVPRARWRAHPAAPALSVVLVVALLGAVLGLVAPESTGDRPWSIRQASRAAQDHAEVGTAIDAAVATGPVAIADLAPAPAATDLTEVDGLDAAAEVEPETPVVEPEVPVPPTPVEHPALVAGLDHVVQGGPPGAVGISVSSADGSPVYSHNSDLPLIPASTQKNVVAAAALRLLGPEHRYRTEVRATGPVGDDGVLRGALVLVGSGDPTLGTPAYGEVVPNRPRARLEQLADQLVASGVRGVSGGVFGDPSVFANEPMAPGWVPAHVANGHAGRVTGLTVDAGRQMLRSGSGYGSVPVVDPAGRAADALRNLLERRGVVVSGPVGANGAHLEGRVVAEIRSAPLSDLVSYMVQTSDNHLADGIFRSLGAAHGDPTWHGAADAVRAGLAGLPLRWDGVVIADGSGLSRQNRLTPDFLADLAAAMGESDLRGHWEASMAVTGERGTLRNRMVGTPAAGRVLAKTGTLSGVRALSGTVVATDGSRYHFAVIGNDLSDAGIWGLLSLQERVAVALVDDLDRCPQPQGIPEPASCAA